MTEFKDLLLTGTKMLELDDEIELLVTLGEVVKNWSGLAGEIDSVANAEQLLTKILEDVESEVIANAFDQISQTATLTKLRAQAARIKELQSKIPEDVRTLLKPVNSFDEIERGSDPGLVGWHLGNKGVDVQLSERFMIGLKGDARIDVEAGDCWPFDGDKMADPLLRLGVEGSIGANASGIIPFKFGTIRAAAAGSVETQLDYYFDCRADADPFALATGKRLAKLPDPFDYDSIWDAFESTDIAGIVYRFDGETKMDVSVSLGTDIDILKFGSIDLGAQFGVSVTQTAAYSLSLRKPAENQSGISATLSQTRASSDTRSAAINASIDLSGLATTVHKALQRALGKWDGALEDIKPFLSPGTWLKGQANGLIDKSAKKLIGNAGLREALVRDLRGTVGFDQNDELALTSWLADHIAGAIDRSSALATDSVADASDRILQQLHDIAPVFSQTDFKAKLKTETDKFAKSISDGLKAKVKDVRAQLDDNELTGKLRSVGATIDGKVSSLDDALSGVRTIIEKYDALFRNIAEKVALAADSKVKIRLQMDRTKTNGSSYVLAGDFLAKDKDNHGLFKAISTGDMARVKSLLTSPEDTPEFLINRKKSSITLTTSKDSNSAFELAFLNFGISGSTLLTAKASSIVDGNGDIQIDAESRLKRRFKNWSEEREIQLVSATSLRMAKMLAGMPATSQRSLELGVTITDSDEEMSRNELDQFLESLKAGNLLSQSAVDRTNGLFDAWIKTGKNKVLKTKISTKLWLEPTAIMKLMYLQRRQTGLIDQEVRSEIIGMGHKALLSSGAINRNRLSEGAAGVAYEIGGEGSQYTIAELLSLTQSDKQWKKIYRSVARGSTGHSSKNPARAFREHRALVHSLADMVDIMGQIYLSEPANGEASSAQGWKLQDYRNAQELLSKAGKKWIHRNISFLWLEAEVHPKTVALMKVLCEMADVEPHEAIAITLTRENTDGKMETFVVS